MNWQIDGGPIAFAVAVGLIFLWLLYVAIRTLIRLLRHQPTSPWSIFGSALAVLFWSTVVVVVIAEYGLLPNVIPDQVIRLGSSIIGIALLIGIPLTILVSRSMRANTTSQGAIVTQSNQPTRSGITTPAEKFCFQCGEKIHGLAEICPKCGLRQPMLPGMPTATVVAPSRPPARVESPNKLAAALLAILLGTFGLHKFYLGKIFWGVLYLVFCWTFIPTILGFIEGIVYLAMSESAFASKYGRLVA